MNVAYTVREKDQYGNFLVEYFGDRREEALRYFKIRSVLLSQELKDWEKETGVYYYIWRKGEEYRELKFVVTEC